MLNSGTLNSNLFALCCSEKSRSYGRRIGDLSVFGIGLVRSHDVIGELAVSLNVEELNDRTNADSGLVDLRLINYLSINDADR